MGKIYLNGQYIGDIAGPICDCCHEPVKLCLGHHRDALVFIQQGEEMVVRERRRESVLPPIIVRGAQLERFFDRVRKRIGIT